MQWSDYFTGLALKVAAKSKDPSTKVGAILVDKHQAIISTGFNGFAKGEGDRWPRRVIHAEMHTLIFAYRTRLAGSTLYVTKAPCKHCAAIICQFHDLYGPLSVVCPPIERAGSRWANSQEAAAKQFAEVGVDVFFTEFL